MNRRNFLKIGLIIVMSSSVNSSGIDNLVLPEGFEISIAANDLNSPRQIAETKAGHIVVGSKKGDKIVALLDDDNDGFFEKKVTLANGLLNPTGVAFYNGDLYFSEIDTVWIIEDIDQWLEKESESLPKKYIYI
ncbi:MAG: hypothetical protein CMM96_00825 [Rickettsiales bacterium]|nr:hypothetical protein [Rickettsiales bacterium]